VKAAGGVADQEVALEALCLGKGVVAKGCGVGAVGAGDDLDAEFLPQDLSCSTAAARKVSAAQRRTEWPRDFRRAVSLALEVVFPVPFTPTIRMTTGPSGEG